MAGGFQAAGLTLGLWTRAPGYLVIAPGGGLRTWMPGSLFFAMIYKMDGFLPTVHQGNRSAPSRPQGGWAHLWDVTARRHLTYIRDL